VHGVHQISVIIENYQKFFVDVTGKQVVDEWISIKRVIAFKGLRSRRCRSSDCGHAC
jgi:hypothetical protein